MQIRRNAAPPGKEGAASGNGGPTGLSFLVPAVSVYTFFPSIWNAKPRNSVTFLSGKFESNGSQNKDMCLLLERPQFF